MININLQRTIQIEDEYSHGVNIYLRYGCCQRHQCWYILKKSILQIAPQVHSWPFMVLNRIFIHLWSLLKYIDMEFHEFQRDYILMYNIFTLLFFVPILWQGDVIPRPIPENIITGFFLVWLDDDLQMSINSNYIKPVISFIIFAYLLFITIIFKGVQLGFNIRDRI